MITIGRNEPCVCGSGKKYKKCCLEKDESRRALERESRIRDEGECKCEYHTVHKEGPTSELIEYCEPLLKGVEGEPVEMEKALKLGILFWNLGVCKRELGEEELKKELKKMEDRLCEGKEEESRWTFRMIAEKMLERFEKMHGTMHEAKEKN